MEKFVGTIGSLMVAAIYLYSANLVQTVSVNIQLCTFFCCC